MDKDQMVQKMGSFQSCQDDDTPYFMNQLQKFGNGDKHDKNQK